MQLIAIALGGALGAVLRYLSIMTIMTFLNSSFPLGTLLVNVVGSLIMGVLVGGLDSMAWFDTRTTLFLITGVLGGFTTFSTFSMDAIKLLDSGQAFMAFTYMAVSLLFTVTACGLGFILAKGVLS